MIRSSTSPILSPLLLYTALSRMVFLALQPTASTFCSSTVTPSVVDPATCPRAVPPTSAHITLAMTATTMYCCIASPFGRVDGTAHRCCMPEKSSPPPRCPQRERYAACSSTTHAPHDETPGRSPAQA